MDEELQMVITRFLRYSFGDINFSYDDLTEAEKTICTRSQFQKLLEWMDSQPKV